MRSMTQRKVLRFQLGRKENRLATSTLGWKRARRAPLQRCSTCAVFLDMGRHVVQAVENRAVYSHLAGREDHLQTPTSSHIAMQVGKMRYDSGQMAAFEEQKTLTILQWKLDGMISHSSV